ncbi:MAG: Hsp20/alpha crystallin family protein [Gemmataceae bacterium]
MFWSRVNPFGNSAWSALQQLNNEVNRAFGRWGDGRAWGESAFPALNVWEDGDTLVAEAELPGLDLKDIEIFITGQNQLTLKGERKAPAAAKSAVHRQEREFGKFVRTIALPFPVDDAKVEARLEDGVLTVRLPKHEAARPRKINIKTA